MDHQVVEAGAANGRPDLAGGWVCKENRYAQEESAVDRYGFKKEMQPLKGNTRSRYVRVALVSDDDKRVSSTPTTGKFTQIEAGIRNTCAVREDGGITCWGNNSDRQSDPPY